MGTFSRQEQLMKVAITLLLQIDPRAASPVFATLMTKQMIDLLEAAGKLALAEAGAQRVKNLCAKLGRRNMRRNHIVHGFWTCHFDSKEPGTLGRWIRRYEHVDPAIAVLEPEDPKILGLYTFTIPALDKATDHVEETVQETSSLIEDIPKLRPPPPSPEEMLRRWVSAQLEASASIIQRLGEYPPR